MKSTAPTTPEALHALITAHFKASPTETLIIEGLREDLYRAYPAVNVSSLKPMADSPRKYRYEQDNPKPRTKAMDFGVIVHGLCLTPEEVPGLWVKKAFPDFRTNAAKAWRDAQTLIILDDEDLAEMTACADSIQADPKAAWILEKAQKEVAVFRIHERTGLMLKARLDLPFLDLENRTAVADIKKVQSVKPSLFSKAIGERLYHMQGAFYADIIGASSFYFIGVEEAAPNEVDIFRQSDASLARGRALYETLLDRLVKCTRENRWPGISEDSETVREIEEPSWAQRQGEEITA